jgi:hypothetical protein
VSVHLSRLGVVGSDLLDSSRPHDVGDSVDKSRPHVDLGLGSPAVHRPATVAPFVSGPSSTALTALGASVHAECATFSPASTDAKTTDENLYSLMDNDKNDQQVDSGDNRRVERSDA